MNTATPADYSAARDRLAQAQRDRAAENFLKAPAEVLALVSDKLTALKRRRDQLQVLGGPGLR